MIYTETVEKEAFHILLTLMKDLNISQLIKTGIRPINVTAERQ